MTKLGSVFWLGLVLTSGFATFTVKYAVQDIDERLAAVRKQTVAEQQEIRVLTAEWTYLNQPERLADLNRRFLKLAPITAQQLRQSIANIALRAPAAAPPDTLIAEDAALKSSTAVLPMPAADAAKHELPVRLAKAEATASIPAGGLDALFAQVAVKTRP